MRYKIEKGDFWKELGATLMSSDEVLERVLEAPYTSSIWVWFTKGWVGYPFFDHACARKERLGTLLTKCEAGVFLPRLRRNWEDVPFKEEVDDPKNKVVPFKEEVDDPKNKAVPFKEEVADPKNKAVPFKEEVDDPRIKQMIQKKKQKTQRQFRCFKRKAEMI